MTMKLTVEENCLNLRPCFFLYCLFLLSAGCVHDARREAEDAYVGQLMKSASALERKKDIAGAVEKMKIALTVDPENTLIREHLRQTTERFAPEAEKHYKTGIAVRESSPQAARKEFLEALRLRPDYMEAVTALRDLQLASSEAVIQKRLKKKAKNAAVRPPVKPDADEDEDYTEDYSLDVAVSSYEDGDYERAAREFEKMQARFPNDPDIRMYLDNSWYNIGMSYFAKKEYQKALASFAKVRKGFQRVDECVIKCRQCLKNSEPARASVSPRRGNYRRR